MYIPGHQIANVADFLNSAIVRTLNATYHNQAYGIGNTHTTYPVSAFITDLVYLKDSEVDIDVKQINVSTGYHHQITLLYPV